MTRHNLRCVVRAVSIYAAAAITGIALAGDAGVQAPLGLPDLAGLSWPAAAVIVAGLLRGQSFTLRIADERKQSD